MYESKYILAATQTCAAAEQRVLALVFLEDIEFVPGERNTLSGGRVGEHKWNQWDGDKQLTTNK